MPTYVFLILSLQRGLYWQFKREHRPVRLIMTRLDVSFMIRNDSADNGKPEPRAAFLPREVRYEEFILVLRSNARAFIGHAYNGASSLRIVIGRQPHTSFVIHRLDRIVQQIHQHPLQLFPIKIQQWEIFIQVDQQFDLSMRTSIEGDDFVDYIVKGLVSHLRRREAGKLRKLIHHVLQTRNLIDDYVC